MLTIQKFSDDYEKYCQIIDEINLNDNWNKLKKKCVSCDRPGHNIINCDLITI